MRKGEIKHDFKITLLVMFIITVFGLFYYVSWSERVEDINEKRRANRKAIIEYQNRIEFKNYMEKRYGIDIDKEEDAI